MIKQKQISDLGASPALSLNVGEGPNQVLQLDSNGKLPAVDGSNITNATSSGGGSGGTSVLNIVDQILTGAYQIPSTHPCGTLIRLVNNTGVNDFAVTLPSASAVSSGYYISMHLYRGPTGSYDSVNRVWLWPKSGDTFFSGQISYYDMEQYKGVTAVSDGSSNWVFVNKGRS